MKIQTQISGKITMLVNKVTLKKSAKKQKHKKKLKNLNAHFFPNYFLDTLGHFSTNLIWRNQTLFYFGTYSLHQEIQAGLSCNWSWELSL